MRSKMLSSLAVAIFLGGGLGIHLGRSAIGAVDPFYFSDPVGTESYAELVPAASLSRPWSTDIEPASLDYGWPASCVGCGSDRTVYEPAPYDGFQEGWTQPAEASPRYAVLEAEPDIETETEAVETGIEQELQQVERYAYYPVSDEAARAHRAAITAVQEQRAPIPDDESVDRPGALLPQKIAEITPY